MKVLQEREKKYGDFKTQAEISQRLKNIIFEHNPNIQKIPYLAEGIEMILHKISRLANGDEKYLDTWRDIVGYSQLVLNNLEKEEGATDSVVRYKKVINGEWVFEGE